MTLCSSLFPADSSNDIHASAASVWEIAKGWTVNRNHLHLSPTPLLEGRWELIEGIPYAMTPSLIFEILSDSTAHKDRHIKYAIYEREGVNYYCIIDPENSVAKIYHLSDGRYVKQIDATEESYRFDLGACHIDFDFSRIWAE